MSTRRARQAAVPEARWPVDPRTTAGLLRWLADTVETNRPAEALKAAGALLDYGVSTRFIAPPARRKHELTSAG